jgi:hypothetical protein
MSNTFNVSGEDLARMMQLVQALQAVGAAKATEAAATPAAGCSQEEHRWQDVRRRGDGSGLAAGSSRGPGSSTQGSGAREGRRFERPRLAGSSGDGAEGAGSGGSGAVYQLPFTAMTLNMPSVFIGLMNPNTDAEDVAAAFLLHWGVPGEIRVIVRLTRKNSSHGRFLTRSRTVSYDDEGVPYAVTIRDIRGVHEYDYGKESYVQEKRGRDAAKGDEEADARDWMALGEEYDGQEYEPSGQVMAFVELHKWYSPACDPIRQSLLAGEQAVLNVDPDVTRGWRFFKCVLGHKRPSN